MRDPLIILNTALAVNVTRSLLVGDGDLKQWPRKVAARLPSYLCSPSNRNM